MIRRVALVLVAAAVARGVVSRTSAQSPDGAAVFARECATCHDGSPNNRAPAPDVLRQRSPEAVLSALTAGGMRPQGGRLTGAERRAVAEYLSGRPLGGDLTGASIGRCAQIAPLSDVEGAPAWRGWAPTNANTRFQTSAQAGFSENDVPRLALKWAFGFPDATSAWSQPTVAGGRLFVGSQNGTVYALDAKSGCIIWTFTAQSGVRTAPVLGARPDGGGLFVYFGDTGANVYALDASNGALSWTRRVDQHPFARVTGTPTFDRGRLYVPISSIEETAAYQPGYACCTFRGGVAALDAATGALIWRLYTVPEPKPIGKNASGTTLYAPAGVGVWASPTVDDKRHLLYIVTGNTYAGVDAEPTTDALLAVDPKDGAIKWSKPFTTGDVFGCRAGSPNCLEKAGPDFDFGTPAMLTTTASGRDVILLGQKSGIAYGVDPDRHGEVLWQYRAGEGSIWGGIQWGMSADGTRVFIPVSDIRTPRPGGLHAVNLLSGDRAWYVPPVALKCKPGAGCNAAQLSAPTLIPGVLFAGANDGGLRAHSTKDGSVVWEFDTNREFATLNHVRATGGSIQGPGPTIAGGMMYVNAGYGDHMGHAGNVLLAFEPQ